jgi:hypothetical protein
LPIRLGLDGIAGIHSVVQTKKILTIKSIFHAHFSFYKSIPDLISKRIKIKHKGYPNTTIKKYILLALQLTKLILYKEKRIFQ